MKAKLYDQKGEFQTNAQIPFEQAPPLIVWRSHGYLLASREEGKPLTYVLTKPYELPTDIPSDDADANKVWNGLAWVSGRSEPLRPPEIPKPGPIMGNFVPPPRLLSPDQLPGSPQPTILPQFQASPMRPSVPTPSVPIDPYTQQLAQRAREEAAVLANLAATNGEPPPLAVKVRPVQPLGYDPNAERPLTQQELTMIQASRQAPGGAVQFQPGAPVVLAEPAPAVVPLRAFEAAPALPLLPAQ